MDTHRSPHSGLPGILERQAYEFLLNLIREYLALQKSHLGFDRINGIIAHAHTRAMQQVDAERTRPRARPPQET